MRALPEAAHGDELRRVASLGIVELSDDRPPRAPQNRDEAGSAGTGWTHFRSPCYFLYCLADDALPARARASNLGWEIRIASSRVAFDEVFGFIDWLFRAWGILTS